MPTPKTHYWRARGDSAVPLCGLWRRPTTMTAVESEVTCALCRRALALRALPAFVPTWPPDWLPPTAWPSSLYARKGGGCCPVCQSGALAGGRFDCEAHVVWQEVHCAVCGAAWQDVYYLQGYDRLDLSAYQAPDVTPAPTTRTEEPV
jgi:hypothetical protein